MTREEAIAIIRKEYLCVDRDCDIERSCGKCDLMMPSKEPILEAYKVAIKALEQEPKTGHWKEVYAETDYRDGWIEFSCENCEYQHGLESGEYGWSYGDPIPWKYCPICGARMVEPQESEDKE